MGIALPKNILLGERRLIKNEYGLKSAGLSVQAGPAQRCQHSAAALLLVSCLLFPPQTSRLTSYPPESVVWAAAQAVHTAEHLATIRNTSACIDQPIAIRDADDPDGPTYATPTSAADALRAVAAALALADTVVVESNKPPAALSVCRPPGHHATAHEQMGFCLLNTAAIVARHLQRQYRLNKARLLECLEFCTGCQPAALHPPHASDELFNLLIFPALLPRCLSWTGMCTMATARRRSLSRTPVFFL